MHGKQATMTTAMKKDRSQLENYVKCSEHNTLLPY